MAYVKQTWVNNVTELNADNMNHIEDGIKNNSDAIDEMSPDVNTAKQDIVDLKQTTTQQSDRILSLENELPNKIAKQDLDVTMEVNFNLSEDSGTLAVIKKKVNLNTTPLVPGPYVVTNILFGANESKAGLMTPAMVKAMSQMQTDIENLQGKTTRLLYTASQNPTATQINNFVVEQGYTAPFAGIAVVVDKTYHIWHYYENTSSWKDDGADTVNTFTNETPGVIQGSNTDGKISANPDGTGSVNGWATVVQNILNLQNALNGLVPTSRKVAGKSLTSDVNLGNLRIKQNGSVIGTYNGSQDIDINITGGGSGGGASVKILELTATLRTDVIDDESITWIRVDIPDNNFNAITGGDLINLKIEASNNMGSADPNTVVYFLKQSADIFSPNFSTSDILNIFNCKDTTDSNVMYTLASLNNFARVENTSWEFTGISTIELADEETYKFLNIFSMNLSTLQSQIESLHSAISNKVEKDTSVLTTPALYGRSADGQTQTVYPMSNQAVSNQIIQRDSNGMFLINEPTLNSHPASKNYVDTIVGNIGTLLDAINGEVI